MKLGACLVVLAAAVFGQTLWHDFISFDDPAYVINNPHVNNGFTWAGVKWAFTGVHVGNWHPLTSLAHMADVSLFGLLPAGHHAMSVLLHGLNGVLMFWVIRGLTGAVWTPFFAAALFVVHPLHVESVAWVSIKKDLLSTVFWWLAIWAYGRYARGGGPRAYLGVMVFLWLGLMSKPMVVTLPVILLLLDLWPLNRYRDRPVLATAWRLGMEKLPLFGLSLVAGLLTIWAQRSDGAVRSLSAVSLEGRIENALHSYVMYLVQTVWPLGLSPYYPHPGNALPFWLALACGMLLLAISAGVLCCVRRWPWLAVGWAWYVVTLLPVIGFITVGDQARADRYTYLPLAGIFLALAFSAEAAVARWPRWRAVWRGVAAAVLAILTLLAIVQTSRWKDDQTLFGHAMAVVPDNAMAAVIVARAHVEAQRFNEAVNLLEEVGQTHGDTRGLHNVLGLAYAGLGEYRRAIAAYETELRFAPDNASALSNCGNAYVALADRAMAEQLYRRAIEADPNHADGHANLGVLEVMAGDNASAEAFLQRAVELAPGDALNWVNLGAVQEALGKREAAIASCKRAMALDPGNDRVRALRAALGM